MGILIGDDSPDVHFQLKVFLHSSGYSHTWNKWEFGVASQYVFSD